MNDTSNTGQQEEAARLIGQRRYRQAIDSLSAQLPEDSDGQTHALTGAAHYGLGEYDEAARHYERALKRDPGKGPWQEMLKQSRANAVAEVNVHVPALSFFDREALLSQPVVREGVLPATPMEARGGPGGLGLDHRP